MESKTERDLVARGNNVSISPVLRPIRNEGYGSIDQRERLTATEATSGDQKRRYFQPFVFATSAAILFTAAITTVPRRSQSGVFGSGIGGVDFCVVGGGLSDKDSVSITRTSKDKLRTPWDEVTYDLKTARKCQADPTSAMMTYDVSERHQDLIGFGGAFTESAALNFAALSDEGQDTVMKLLFGSDGLGYSMGRTHINSCDFSVASYSFDDVDGDFDLLEFDSTVGHDQRDMIPMMKTAAEVLREGWGEDMHIVASPWSPPAWMKSGDKGSMLGSEKECLREGYKSKYAETWARFLAMWVDAYKANGVNIWAVTVQNEPEFAAPWEACTYNSTNERDFVETWLGPIMRQEHPKLKILGFDHNKDHAPSWADELLPSEFVDGIGYHWYAGGMDRLLDGAQGTANMHKLNAIAKDRGGIILGTEACHCPGAGYTGGDLDVNWARAERYGHTLLADLSAGSSGWIEWNLILDKLGGPNHLGNVCDAPLVRLGDAFEKGKAVGDIMGIDALEGLGGKKELLEVDVMVHPMYWMMGHFSRFLRRGTVSVDGLMDGRGIFSKTGTSGGDNSLARAGVELTLWPCEGSNRQKWEAGGRMKTGGEGALDGEYVCWGADNDPGFGGVLLVPCTIGKVWKEECLKAKPLEGGGGSLGTGGAAGATLMISDGNCDELKWTEDGEAKIGDLCVTSGWPFLQGAAFQGKQYEDIIIILNEAAEATKVEVGDLMLEVGAHEVVTLKLS